MERRQAENEAYENKRKAGERKDPERREESDRQRVTEEQRLLEETAEDRSYEAWWKKEKDRMDVMEEYTQQAENEEILQRQKAIGAVMERKDLEKEEDTRKLVKEFEEDVWFRTQFRVPAAEYQSPMASFIQAKSAYENAAQLDKKMENRGVLPRKKA